MEVLATNFPIEKINFSWESIEKMKKKEKSIPNRKKSILVENRWYRIKL